MIGSFVDFVLTVDGKPDAYYVSAYGPSGTSLEPVPFIRPDTELFNLVLEGLRYGQWSSLADLKRVGKMLFRALLPRRVLRAYLGALQGLSADKGLRVKLNIRPPEIARLPWELLYDGDQDFFLVKRHDHPLVRTLDTTIAAAPLKTNGRLRILHVQASPIDQSLLDLEKSREAVKEAFGQQAEVTSLVNATPRQVREALHEDYHILHYDGHATFDEMTGQGMLYLHDEQDMTAYLTAEMLADYLAGTSVRLVVLSGCHTGVDATTHRFAGLAQHLMHTSNLPALVAMQYAVDDAAAITFNGTFYRTLMAGHPLETAMVEGRLAIEELYDGVDWLAPLLFMRVEDGSLFALNTEKRAQTTGPHWVAETPFLAPPLPAYPLIGRDWLLAELKGLLFRRGHMAVAALRGLPGVGKTAVAVTLAHDAEVLSYFRDGVLWAGLGANPDVLSILGIWAMALGFTSEEVAKRETIDERKALLHVAIGQRKILIVIDDVWETNLASHFRLGGANCAHLITTRHPSIALDFAGENRITVNELDAIEGLNLLKNLASKAVAQEPKAARELVQVIDGLPLALVLMGRYLRKQTHDGQPHRLRFALEELREKEERMLLEQSKTPGHFPSLADDTPISLLAAIAVSDEALNDHARHTLHALSIFHPKPNTFSLDAAVAVAGTSMRALDHLTDAGLLEPSGSGRYTLHQVIADYASLEISDPEPHRQRMATYFTHFVHQHSDHQGYDLLEAEWTNLQQVLNWADQRQEWGIFVALVQALTTIHLGLIGFMDAKGRYQDGEQLLKQALSVTPALGSPLIEADLLTKLGAFAYRRADFTQARSFYQSSQHLLAHLSPSSEVVLQRAYLYEFMAKAEMQRHLQNARQMAIMGLREISSLQSEHARAQQGYFYVLLATLEGRMGELPTAVAAAEKGLKLLPLGPSLARISAHITLGNVLCLQGELEKSTYYLLEGVKLAQELGDLNRLATLWMNVAINHEQSKHLRTAIKSYKKAIEFYKQMRDIDGEVRAYNNLALSYIILQQDEPALHYLNIALKTAEANQMVGLEAFVKTNLAHLHISRGQLEEASLILNRAYEICQQLELTYLLSGVLYWQAEIARLDGKLDHALHLVNESLQVASQGGDALAAGTAYAIKGKILDNMRRHIEADAAHQRSLRILMTRDVQMTNPQTLPPPSKMVAFSVTMSDYREGL